MNNAIKELGITQTELENMTIIKLSRLFSKKKLSLDDEDCEAEDRLYDAYEKVRDYICNKKSIVQTSQNFQFPETLYPSIKRTEDVITNKVHAVVNLILGEEDGKFVFGDFAIAETDDSTPLFVLPPTEYNDGDTLTFVANHKLYTGKIYNMQDQEGN